MTAPRPISLASLDQHPVEALRAMELLRIDDVAALLARTPARIAAPALGTTLSWRAAQYLAALSPEHAAAIVSQMPSDRRAPCLRAMESSLRDRLLDRLRSDRAPALRRQLQYPTALVGGVMEPVVAPARSGDTRTDAVEAWRGVGATHASHLTVVDNSGLVAGAVAFATLLPADAKRTMAELMEAAVTPLAADTPITQIVVDSSWDEWPERPVVDTRGRVSGSVTLARLLLDPRRIVPPPERAASGGALLSAYATAVTGLQRVASDLFANTAARRDGG